MSITDWLFVKVPYVDAGTKFGIFVGKTYEACAILYFGVSAKNGFKMIYVRPEKGYEYYPAPAFAFRPVTYT